MDGKELERELFFAWPGGAYLLRVLLRLGVAAVLGGLIGFEREWRGKPAGIRTHMLVAMGAALFVLVPLELGMHSADLSRVIQGLVTGIGFLGGGVILKLSEEHQVRGLTTAAAVWATAAVGLAVGVGAVWAALCGTALTWGILILLHPVEVWARGRGDPRPPGEPPDPPRERPAR